MQRADKKPERGKEIPPTEIKPQREGKNSFNEKNPLHHLPRKRKKSLKSKRRRRQSSSTKKSLRRRRRISMERTKGERG